MLNGPVTTVGMVVIALIGPIIRAGSAYPSSENVGSIRGSSLVAPYLSIRLLAVHGDTLPQQYQLSLESWRSYLLSESASASLYRRASLGRRERCSHRLYIG